MKPSWYLKAYPLEGTSEDYLLFSCKRGSLVRVSAQCQRNLLNDRLTPSDAAVLTKLGMIVESRESEKQEMIGLFDRMNTESRGLNLMVVLNLDCNFACVYCYEGGMKGRRYMSQQTADRLMDFISARFDSRKTNLNIDFYGGEPLLSMARIRQIATAAGKFAGNRGAAFTFTLVSNGSLFTRRIAEELVELGLKSIKITLDGPAELHNHSRPYKNGMGSFEDIIANIRETWDLAKIGIGGNYEKHTYPEFVSLLDYLGKADLTPDRITAIKFDPVMKQPDTDFALPDYKGGCISLNEPWLIEADAFLREEILKRGYRTQKVRPVACMVELKDSYVIHYDGVIYKCPGLIGQKEFAAGDIEDGLSDCSAAYHLGYWKNEKCADCEYLPLCFGGCRYLSYLKTGKIGTLDCRKAYLDEALETLVKQDAGYAQVFNVK